MIRLATRADLDTVVNLLMEFLSESSYAKHCKKPDADHLKRLVFSVLHQGYIWILFQEGQPKGVLAAVKEVSIWQPDFTGLRELVWYVKPELRGTASAGRLFVKFCQTADLLLNTNKIQGYFTTRMSTTRDYDLESRGFRLTEKLYLKD